MKKRAFGKLYKELFYVPKHEKLKEKVFRCRMAVSLLTILACTAILAASTFALFYSEVSTDHSTIAGAYYSVTVGKAENETYICPLVFEDKHTFEIKADGTATTGYCKIQVGEQVYYTEQIPQGASLILTVQAAKDTVVTFTPGWGMLTEETCGTEIIHSATPYTTYTVEPTARISSIAAHYGVTEEDILIYNNLLAATVAEGDDEANTPLLTVGMELKIPNPAENVEPYTVPYATYIVEPTATLEGISEYYGISVVDIVTYNGSVDMTAGNIIKIPGVSPDTPSYVAPVPEPPKVEDTVSGGDVGTGEQTTEQQPTQEPVSAEKALLTPGDTDFVLISESTITLKNADILLYKGKEYQKGLDLRITGIEAVADMNSKTGEYFCKLLTNTETLSLCLEITENIENGYLKVIIGESEYYTVQIKKDAYIRLDIVAPIGTEIRFEAYEGVPVADILYGDDLKDDTDGNNPLLDHTWLTAQNVDPVAPVVEPTDPTAEDNTVSGDDTTPTEQPTAETPAEDTTPTEETPTTEQPIEETPAPEETTSGSEDNGDEQPTEESAPAEEDTILDDNIDE